MNTCGDQDDPSSSSAPSQGDTLRQLKAIHFKLVTASQRLNEELTRPLAGSARPRTSGGGTSPTQGELIASLAGEFKAVIERLASTPSVRGSAAVQKVLRDFEGALKRAEMMLKEARRRQKQADERADKRDGDWAVEREGRTHTSQFQQTVAQPSVVDREVEANEAVIRERDTAMAHISAQIGDVHQIFVDLAVLVSDQGGQVDDIESNIERAKQRTEDGIAQIRRAERKAKRGRCNVFFLTGLAGMAVLVLLVVVMA